MRQAGWAAVVSFVLLFAANAVMPLWEVPTTTASAAEVAEFLREDRGRLIASLFVFGLGMAVFLLFAAGLTAFLGRQEQGPPVLTIAFAFGAVSLTTLVLAGFVPAAVAAYRTPNPTTAQPLYDLTFGLLALSGLPTAVATGAYAELIRRTRALPAWTAWLALVAAVSHVAIAGSFAFRTGFLSLEGAGIVAIPTTLFVWMLATGIALLRAPAAAGRA